MNQKPIMTRGMKLELFLANTFFILSKDERKVYKVFNEVEAVLNNGSDLDELLACKNGKLREAYGLYADCEYSRFKPYFYARFHKLARKANERISSLSELRSYS